ncbi:MAG: glycosyltransferase family 39 protein [Candidatus Omnitrophota bacterium]
MAIQQVLFIGLWWICFFVYPLWYLPGLGWERLAVAAGLFAIFLFCSALYRWICLASASAPCVEDVAIPDAGFFGVLFVIAFLLHLPFLNQPLITGLDIIDHAAVPAVAANRFVRSLSQAAGFNLQLLLIASGVLTILHFVFRPAHRRMAKNAIRKTAEILIAHFGKSMLVLFLVTSLYGFFLYYFAIPDRFGNIGILFRYPPLSKIVLMFFYGWLGLYEWIGRTVQILFTLAGAVYFHRLTSLYGGKDAARLAAILYVFLPPVFHYGNTHMIEGGTLFFVIAAFFHLIRCADRRSPIDLAMGTLFMTGGCLYKHTAVSVIPAFALMTAIDFFFPPKGQTRAPLLPAIASCAIASLTMIVYMKLSSFNSEIPSDMVFPTLQRLFANLAAIPLGVTWPIALAFPLGIICLLLRRKWRVFEVFFCWIGAHLLLSVMASTYRNVRQALPYYIGFITPAALFMESIISGRPKIRIAFLYFLLPLYLFWVCLLADRDQTDLVKKRAMGDRSYITFANWNRSYLPYPDAIRDLNEITKSNETIYAPMANDPVHFYIAKYDLQNPYIRAIWEPSLDKQTLSSLYAHCRRIGAQWLMVPRGRWLSGYVNPAWVEELFANPPSEFQLEKIYTCGKEELGLWRVRQ